MLLLLWNGLWGALPPERDRMLPPGWEFTADRARQGEADAVVFHLPDLRELPARKPDGQRWAGWSMECEVHHPHLRDPAFLRRFDVSMTYRRAADVWTPYLHAQLPALFERPLQPKDAGAPVAAFVSSAFDRSGRLALLDELMQLVPVHSYGKQRRNRELPGDAGWESKIAAVARYPFTLALENAVAPDYVTEKLYDALVAGSVPVYLGAPNVRAFAPSDHCFIDARAFRSAADLARYLRALLADEQAYRSYLSWRARPLRTEFLAMIEAVREPPFARLCRLVAAGTRT
jgi:alpha-1,3-fucosyltransferase 10